MQTISKSISKPMGCNRSLQTTLRRSPAVSSRCNIIVWNNSTSPTAHSLSSLLCHQTKLIKPLSLGPYRLTSICGQLPPHVKLCALTEHSCRFNHYPDHIFTLLQTLGFSNYSWNKKVAAYDIHCVSYHLFFILSLKGYLLGLLPVWIHQLSLNKTF